jgi:hypothetical protein
MKYVMFTVTKLFFDNRIATNGVVPDLLWDVPPIRYIIQIHIIGRIPKGLDQLIHRQMQPFRTSPLRKVGSSSGI